MSRWLPRTHAVSTPVAGVPEGPDTVRGRQSAVDTGMAIDTSLANCAGHQPSGERSLQRPFRKQRTVNPLIVPSRYNFLYASSRPALRAASGPAATRRPPGNRPHPARTGNDGHKAG
jgi:hypothetical protein